MRYTKYVCASLLALCFESAHANDGGCATPIPAQAALEDEDCIDSEALKTIETAWVRFYVNSVQPHLRTIAGTGKAHDMLAAALLWPVFDSLASTNPATAPQQASSQQAKTWMEAARHTESNDSLIAWIDAISCDDSAATCSAQTAIQTLLRQEPDNAAALVLAIADAEKASDMAEVDRLWEMMPGTSRYDTHTVEISRLLHTALQNTDWPPLDTDLANLAGAMLGVDRPATAQEFVNFGIAGTLAGLPWPDLATMHSHCKPEASITNERRAQCDHVLELMAKNDENIITPMLGLSLLVQSTGETPKAMARREALRQIYWVYENASARLPHGSSEASLGDYYDWLMIEGESPAMRRLLERDDLPTTAPPGWLPSDERRRSLVSTGRRL